MTYKIAHISDLHLSRSIEDCYIALYKDLRDKKIDKIIKKHEEFDEKIWRALIAKPTPPRTPRAVVVPTSPYGPRIVLGERAYMEASRQYYNKLKIWEEFAKALGVTIKELEDEADKLNDSIYQFVLEFFYKLDFARNQFDPLFRSFQKEKVDHIVVTGDLTNLSRELEYKDFKSAFSGWIDNSNRISVVPGNHDTKLFSSSISFVDALEDLIPKEYPELIKKKQPFFFPYVKQLSKNIFLIGLDSTKEIKRPHIKELYGNSIGRISKSQLKELKEILPYVCGEGRFVIVAIHHHLIDVPDHYQRQIPFFMEKMRGSESLLRLLKKFGVQIILNGHIHCQRHAYETRDRPEILTADSLADPYADSPNYNLLAIENQRPSVSSMPLRGNETSSREI